MTSAKTSSFRAVFLDFGGVVTSSPFDAFNAYEQEHGLPRDFIRTVNSRNHDTNAWARLERNDIDTEKFDELFFEESKALGYGVRGKDIMALFAGEIRPGMVDAIRTIKAHYKVACLTNNVKTGFGANMQPDEGRAASFESVFSLFDFVLESSKAGIRKPEPAFYRLACQQAQVAPSEVVFLDDLGINLKPARAMGMTTIKVVSGQQALADLQSVLGLRLL